MKQQRCLDKQEIKQKIAEQKAKGEAFACCQCPKKFSSNTKLHKYIVAHHTKLPLSAFATPLFSSFALPTPLASSPSATSKLSYATIADPCMPFTPSTTLKVTKATSFAPPTPLTTPTPATPKIAKSTCAIPKPATYMTIEDLFWKFASCNTEPPHQHAANRPQSLQIPLSILHQKATVSYSLATILAFNKCAQSTKSVPSSIPTCFAIACHAIPT